MPVAMTTERAERSDSRLKQILLENHLTTHEASSLAGKLQFVAQPLFGKASAAALQADLQAGHFWASRKDWQLTDGLKEALAFTRMKLRTSSIVQEWLGF